MAKILENLAAKICVQTAVYWGSPVAAVSGGMTFATPVEIYCRWYGSDKIVISPDGVQQVYSAEVVVLQDLDEQGYLYLGSLSGLTITQKANPKKVAGASRIIKFEKIPMLFSTDDFMRTAYL